MPGCSVLICYMYTLQQRRAQYCWTSPCWISRHQEVLQLYSASIEDLCILGKTPSYPVPGVWVCHQRLHTVLSTQCLTVLTTKKEELGRRTQETAWNSKPSRPVTPPILSDSTYLFLDVPRPKTTCKRLLGLFWSSKHFCWSSKTSYSETKKEQRKVRGNFI